MEPSATHGPILSGFTDLIRHMRRHALRTDVPFTLRSGRRATWYLDAKQSTLDGEGAWLVGEAMLEVVGEDVAALGGLTMGADPVALATVMVAHSGGRHLRAFSIRKAEKSHGVGSRLVGPVQPGDRVAVVEDTTTTGGALIEAIEVAREGGLEVVQAISLCDRSDGLVAGLLEQRSIRYQALFGPSDLGVG